jgi:predicted dienelactone hydrolase
MKILRILSAVVLLVTLGIGAALWLTRPEPLPENSESARRLAPGPYLVDLTETVWIDATRPTDANGDFEGAPARTFEIAMWSPADAPGPHPLVVYSHGFMSDRHGGTYLGEHLASYGYVVVATSFPLTHYNAPGGPNADDVAHQPADVSFLIDQVLALGPDERPFPGGIDREKIAVAGVSLGALTSTLVTYHPRFADPRIRMAISIAGPSVMFGERYFDFADVPFLMIAGTHDSMIPFEENAAPLPDKIEKGGLVAIDGGSHAGFSHLTAGPLRLLGNPDEIGCRILMGNLEIEQGGDAFTDLGGPEDGLIDARGTTTPCQVRYEEAMAAGRQQWLTVLAARAFLESQFANDPAARAAHAQFLERTLPGELSAVQFTPARRTS